MDKEITTDSIKFLLMDKYVWLCNSEISNNIGTENVMDRIIFTKLIAIFQIET